MSGDDARVASKKYQIIYADPPWTISQMSNIPSGRPNSRPYKAMRQVEIFELPVVSIANTDCVLCRKPDEVRDRIVALCGNKPRIELFARQRTEGWDAWGNEIRSDIKLESDAF